MISPSFLPFTNLYFPASSLPTKSWDQITTILVRSGIAGKCTLVRPPAWNILTQPSHIYCPNAGRKLHNHNDGCLATARYPNDRRRFILKSEFNGFFLEDDSSPTSARQQKDNKEYCPITKRMLLNCWANAQRVRSCPSPAGI